MPVGDPIVAEEPVDAFWQGCTAAERRSTGRNSRGAPQRLETTLLDVVSEISDTLQDDEWTVRLVAHLIREGRVRTSLGPAVQLSSE